MAARDHRLAAWLAAGALALGCQAATAGAADIRILVDVSGSMKRNDPSTLRIPALRLMASLLPEGTQAGIWMFAGAPQPLVPPAAVDAAWRRRALAALERVHSRGQRTDIEAALGAAAADWSWGAGAAGRHIVLLTDGVVDVAAGAPHLSEASRERILGEQLARLQQAGAKVHAIALSEDVDEALMRRLTESTGGWLESAAEAGALRRAFLHMLEQAAPPATVPIEGNRFVIDESIHELTLLAFRAEGAGTRLIPPTGDPIGRSDRRPGVRWRAERGFDLVTVDSPAAGEWRLEGAEDPDNRVVVVTDLALALAETPAAIAAGRELPVAAWLTDHAEPVTQAELLGLVDARVRLKPAAGGPPAIDTGLDLQAASARFAGALGGASPPPGTYTLEVRFDGGTFERARQRRIRLLPPPVSLAVRASQDAAGGSAGLAVALQVAAGRLQPASLAGFVRVAGPAGGTRVFEIEPGNTRLTVPAGAAGQHRVSARLTALGRDGALQRLAPVPVEVEVTAASAPAAGPTPAQPAPARSIEPLRVAALVAAGNGLALPAFLLTWLALRHRRSSAATQAPA